MIGTLLYRGLLRYRDKNVPQSVYFLNIQCAVMSGSTFRGYIIVEIMKLMSQYMLLWSKPNLEAILADVDYICALIVNLLCVVALCGTSAILMCNSLWKINFAFTDGLTHGERCKRHCACEHLFKFSIHAYSLYDRMQKHLYKNIARHV